MSSGYGESSSRLPTRLLALDGKDDVLSPNVHLQETCQHNSGAYVALSHRWDSTNRLVTNKANITKHYETISYNDLPKTIQDAITVCRFMDIQYLWIDTLCIIQDDLEDWERESRFMGDIYHNAVCTIAAHTTTHDNKMGFLHASSKARESVILGGHQKTESFSVSVIETFEGQVLWNSPLSRRGWILQERLLSRQILHFVPSNIYWEAGNDIRTADTSFIGEIRGPRRLPTRTISDHAREWLNIIEWYSRCDLTFESDRLPAIAGLAAHIQFSTNAHYMAGLWYDNMPQGLLWMAVRRRKLRQPEVKCAPSWSWASYQGHVIFPFSQRNPDEEVRGNGEEFFSMIDFSVTKLDNPRYKRGFGPIVKIPEKSMMVASLTGDLLGRDYLTPLQVTARIKEIKNLGTLSPWVENLPYRLLFTHVPQPDSVERLRVIKECDQVLGWLVLDKEDESSLEDKGMCALVGTYSEGGRFEYLLLILSECESGSKQYRRLGLGGVSKWSNEGSISHTINLL
jgi:hypothetical protein